MPQGLSVSRLINVSVNLSPTAVATLNFDSLLVMGDSNVINITDRIRSYNTLAEVATDFGTTAPEYLAADLFFSQNPQPGQIYIGRWAQAATHGLLVGGALTATQQLIATWNAVTTGAFKIAVDGGSLTGVSSLDFSSDANLNAVASRIQTAVRALAGAFAAVTVVWNSALNQFTFGSGTTGASSAVAALAAPASGTDISGMLLCTAGTLEEIVPGIAAETAVQAVTIMDGLSTSWYGLMFATTHAMVDSEILPVAAYIEGDANPHVYGVTTSEAAALTTNDTTSIGYQLKQLDYNRTFVQYCSTSAYAVASFFGRAFTVDFNGNNSTLTMAYKQEPGVLPESLTPTQADALNARHYSYYAGFNNGANIIVNGTMASGVHFDEQWGVDWQANRIQTDVFNLLYTSPTKVPQTDAGNHLIKTTIEGSLSAGVNNGLIGAGLTWNEPGFGQIAQGDVLPKGFYVYQPPISSQSQSSRAARQSVPFQCAVTLAGAVQSVSITVNVNR